MLRLEFFRDIVIPFLATWIVFTGREFIPFTIVYKPRSSQVSHESDPHLQNQPPPIAASVNNMPGPTYTQHALVLPSYSRGSYLITSVITSQLSEPLKGVKAGLLHLFLQHTSCGLSLNENWDSDVRKDMSDSLDRIVVEDIGALGGGTKG